MQNKLTDGFPSCLIHFCCTTLRNPSAASEPRTTTLCARFNSRSYNAEIIQLQSALDDEYDSFQETSNPYHILEPIIGRLFQNIIPGRSLQSSFIDPFSFAQKRCNTSQGFSAFFIQSCDQVLFLFSLFLVFSVLS